MVVQSTRSGRVRDEVRRPAHDQVSEELEAREAFFPDGVEQSNVARLLDLRLGVRIVRFSIHEVVRLGVVLGVGVLPGIVRDQEEGVEYESDAVVDELGSREAAAEVCQVAGQRRAAVPALPGLFSAGGCTHKSPKNKTKQKQ